jgi:hypothetical protein
MFVAPGGPMVLAGDNMSGPLNLFSIDTRAETINRSLPPPLRKACHSPTDLVPHLPKTKLSIVELQIN